MVMSQIQNLHLRNSVTGDFIFLIYTYFFSVHLGIIVIALHAKVFNFSPNSLYFVAVLQFAKFSGSMSQH